MFGFFVEKKRIQTEIMVTKISAEFVVSDVHFA